jgi:hypothetical protein
MVCRQLFFIVGSAKWKNFFSRYSGCICASYVGGGGFTAFFFVKIFIAVTAGRRKGYQQYKHEGIYHVKCL